jgi:hypothetical protein
MKRTTQPSGSVCYLNRNDEHASNDYLISGLDLAVSLPRNSVHPSPERRRCSTWRVEVRPTVFIAKNHGQ